ncbi:hypothetical protein SARC_04123 [Sphaeroforma arctica JP610]|uniref:Uncharacterized protein n=1 Tax=Sphaeroforma arctica JP610 TaxID=667725 RepID=A0A0L0G440_9EUKA|nr:hypothetical protein SARC_04123 [Sphaeroforma arctica JP610]KNC83624.1 hypothetical protein SARC_04123 [Sphaeroforma arctica JP610]|eukprot:XP_014157526.1 hypothetical protein SARC_04123 [Sphaeroforma arctica JP610]
MPINLTPAYILNKILDEEEYNEGIDAIIEREFFPQVGRLRAENEYLDAKAENDVIGMRTIARKAAMARTLEGTPAASPHIRTPGALPSVTPSLLGGRGNETPGVSGTQYFSGQEASQSEGPRVKASTGLNEFLRTHASEDNAEFEVLMAKQREANKQKYAWLHAVEAKSEEKRLAITAAQDENLGVVKTIEAARDNSTNGALIGWDYKNKNSLMYFPDGTNQSVSTLDSVKAASKQVVVANTRLRENPFKKPADVKKKPSTSLFGVGTVLGSISIAGHEKVAPSPEVRGYGFIGTPVPRPGEGDGLGGVGLAGDESPMMTWGSIEDTPFRIETEATPGVYCFVQLYINTTFYQRVLIALLYAHV